MNTQPPAPMNTAHTPATTPGPWQVISNGGVIHPEAIMAPNAKGIIVAITLAVWPEPIRKANAQLLASAPTLLAQRNELRDALKACAAMLESLAGPDDRTIMANYVNPARNIIENLKP